MLPVQRPFSPHGKQWQCSFPLELMGITRAACPVQRSCAVPRAMPCRAVLCHGSSGRGGMAGTCCGQAGADPPCEGGWRRDTISLLGGNWEAGPKAPFQTGGWG